MNRKMTKNKTVFTIRINEEEMEIMRQLKENHALNISQAFKIFLKLYLEKVRGVDKNELIREGRN